MDNKGQNKFKGKLKQICERKKTKNRVIYSSTPSDLGAADAGDLNCLSVEVNK